MELPALPPPPPLSANPTPDEHDRYMRYVAEVRLRADLLARDRLATAQADTAKAIDRAAAAQEALLVEMGKPAPKQPLDRASLAARYLETIPQVTGQTDLQQADLAIARADALLKRFPGG